MGILRALTRLLPEKSRPETPTTSIYFAVPMAGHIGAADEGAPIQRLEPNVFVCGETMVVMRHWSEPTRRLLAARPDLNLIYFIDDDLWALETGSVLPSAYRGRLEQLRSEFDEQLRSRVARVISPSAQILAHFPDVQTLKLDPALIYPLAPLDHHDEEKNGVRMVFCATASHLADLRMISGDLSALLRAHAGLHLTTFLGNQVPDGLRLNNCHHLAPQSWAEYRQSIANTRFHIGLAPLQSTAFNTARSATRMLDHAALGAAGIYSNIHPFCSVIDPGQDGVLVRAQPDGWSKAILQLAEDPIERKRLAMEGQRTAGRIGDQLRVRQFWRELLGI